MAQDTIDLVGHCGLGHKAVTHFCDVDKPLKNGGASRTPKINLFRGSFAIPYYFFIASTWLIASLLGVTLFFTIPYLLTCYVIHSRFAVYYYNEWVKNVPGSSF